MFASIETLPADVTMGFSSGCNDDSADIGVTKDIREELGGSNRWRHCLCLSKSPIRNITHNSQSIAQQLACRTHVVNTPLAASNNSNSKLMFHGVTIANHKYEDIEAQLYGFDKTMAPAGRGTIKVELTSSYAYWRQLYNDDTEKYKLEKQKVAGQVIEILESHFAGIRDQVEVIDVRTLMAWERYMGGSQGWFDFPNRKLDFTMREDLSDKKFRTTLPGLSNFYLVGVWATAMGSLAHNATSGKTIIRRICKVKDGR